MPAPDACKQCTFLIGPGDSSSLIGRRKGKSTIEVLEFCSTVCWCEWLGTVHPDDWSSMILPRLNDSWDIRSLAKALSAQAQQKAIAA